MTENNFLFFDPIEETVFKKVTFSTSSLASLEKRIMKHEKNAIHENGAKSSQGVELLIILALSIIVFILAARY